MSVLNYVSLRGNTYVVAKLWRTGQGMLVKVPEQKSRSYDFMSIESVSTAYDQYGIAYECNGDFNSIHKEVEFST